MVAGKFSRFRGKLKISLRYKLLMVFLGLGLIPVITVGIISYIQSYNSIYQNSVTYSNSVIKQVADNFDRWLSEYVYTTMEMINSQEFQAGLDNVDEDFIIDQNYKLKMTFYAVNRPEIADIAVYRSNDRIDSLKAGYLITSLLATALKGSELIGKDFYDKVTMATGQVIWESSKVYRINEAPFENNITMARKILGFNSGKDFGIFVMHIDSKYIRDIYNDVNLVGNGYIVIVDNQGKIISTGQPDSKADRIEASIVKEINAGQAGSLLQEINGSENLISYSTSKVTGWKVLSIVPTASLMKNIYITTGIIILIACFIIIVIMIISIIASSLIFRPIKQLQSQMKRVEAGDLNVQIQPVTRDEIGDLTQGFLNMMSEVKNLLVRQEEEQKKLKSAELLALQSQINPHFLYNTIDVALWYAKDSSSVEIQNILLSLARFYRISLNSGNNIISIANELEHVKSYIEIESIRFEGKFEVEYDIDEDILQYAIVKLTLQPLVENAIKHGIRKRPGKGRINIAGRREGENIKIMISDDGVGMTEAQMNDLFSANGEYKVKSCGYGIHNVSDRLKLQFGKEYGLKYSSVKGEGTCAEILIPAKYLCS